MKKKVIKTLIGTTVIGLMAVTSNGNVVNKNNIKTTHSIENVQLESKANALKPKETIKAVNPKKVELKVEKKTDSKEQQPSELVVKPREVQETREYHNFYISFYTSLSSENTNNGTGTDDKGNPLVYGTVADNFLPYGTRIYLKGFGTMTVRDVGSPSYFTNRYTLDVFIPREQGETNQEYYNRVNNMGRLVVKGYILK